MPEFSAVEHSIEHVELHANNGRRGSAAAGSAGSTSLGEVLLVIVRHRVVVLSVLGALLAACLLYCLIAPREYDATARVALRTVPASSLILDDTAPRASTSELGSMVQIETVAGVLRSDRLAWKIILDQKLYDVPAFRGRFAYRFPGFRPEAAGPDAQACLLERFRESLQVGTVPRTLLIEIRFRSQDPRLSADVVNALIAAYGRQQADQRAQATREATRTLDDELHNLKARADEDDRRLAGFQKKHGILIAPQSFSNGAPAASGHLSALVEVDELSMGLRPTHMNETREFRRSWERNSQRQTRIACFERPNTSRPCSATRKWCSPSIHGCP